MQRRRWYFAFGSFPFLLASIFRKLIETQSIVECSLKVNGFPSKCVGQVEPVLNPSCLTSLACVGLEVWWCEIIIVDWRSLVSERAIRQQNAFKVEYSTRFHKFGMC